MFVIKCFAIYSTIVIWLLGQGNSSIYYGALSCTVDNQGTYSVDWNDFPIHEKNIIAVLPSIYCCTSDIHFGTIEKKGIHCAIYIICNIKLDRMVDRVKPWFMVNGLW